MPIEFYCPNCRSRLRVPLSSAGKKAQCPQCSTITTVPIRSEAPSAETAGPVRYEPEPQTPGYGADQPPTAGFAPIPPAQPAPGQPVVIAPQMLTGYPGQPGYAPPAPKKSGNGMSTAALVLGLIGLVGWCCPFVGIILGILAVIFGIIGAARGGGGMAIGGIVLGVIVILLSIVNAVLGVMISLLPAEF